MSREFGEYQNAGYFHDKISSAAEDALNGRDELTKLWGAFLSEFSITAYAISTAEACDSGPEYPITDCMSRIEKLRNKFEAIECFLNPFHNVAKEAVRKALEQKS